ncbi:MAG: PEP-CTERM sorting domain-containing protein [Rubrivivax sp.]|nr:MAG: PEP-CTERM sorting domain-containing protein [Rubrivivax sp.]
MGSLPLAAALVGGSAWGGPTPGTSFGVMVNAGGSMAGGEFQSVASAQYQNRNVNSVASGASDSLSLHAYAWTSEQPSLPSYCTVYTCSWQTYANVSVWDTITVTAKADGSEGPQTLRYGFISDGSRHRGKWAYGSGTSAFGSYYFGTKPKGWFDTTQIPLTTYNGIKGEITARPGETLTLYLYAFLGVSAQSGSWADYGNTTKFLWDLPEGWTYTSASGMFSAGALTPLTPVPEPATGVLCIAGIGLLGAWQRTRRRSPAA